MAVPSWKVGSGESCFGGNPGLLDVPFLDPERNSLKDKKDLLQISLEWKKRRTDYSLGELEKDCKTKRSWRLGLKGHLFIL